MNNTAPQYQPNPDSELGCLRRIAAALETIAANLQPKIFYVPGSPPTVQPWVNTCGNTAGNPAPPVDNAHVADGCEPFSSGANYVPAPRGERVSYDERTSSEIDVLKRAVDAQEARALTHF